MTNWLIGAIAAHGGDARHLRVRLTRPFGADEVLVQANLTTHGRPMRLQMLGPSIEDAGLLLAERLSLRLTRDDRFHPRPWPISQPQTPGPGGPQEVTRRKQARLARLEAIDAARTMDDLDYDAHLYTDARTGHNAVIYRAEPTGYRLAGQRPLATGDELAAPLVADSRLFPVLLPEAALQLLAITGDRSAFFTDLSSGHATLLYARYAGGYGLLRGIV